MWQCGNKGRGAKGGQRQAEAPGRGQMQDGCKDCLSGRQLIDSSAASLPSLMLGVAITPGAVLSSPPLMSPSALPLSSSLWPVSLTQPSPLSSSWTRGRGGEVIHISSPAVPATFLSP